MPVKMDELLTENQERLHITHSMDEALDQADVIMMLRVQFERMNESFFPSVREYFRYYGLSRERASRAKSDAIIMHPGPDQPRRGDRIGCGRRTVFGNSRPGRRRCRGAHGNSVSAAGGVMDLVIKNGRVVDPARKIDAVVDVVIRDGKIRFHRKGRAFRTFRSSMRPA